MSGWVAGAIVVGSAYQADQASDAAKDAGRVQADSSQLGIDEQRRQYDLTRQDLAPWMRAGSGALTLQQALLGLSGQEAQQAAYEQFKQSPGQAFLQARGQKNLLANASAIGGLGGGNVRSALVQQGVGFAQQDFGDWYNRIAGLSGTGQQTGAQLGGFGQQSAANIGNLLGNQGAARASGILGAQQANAQGMNNLIGLGSMYLGGGFGGSGGGAM